MKASELAEILLKTPDLNVYIETHHYSEFSDSFILTEEFTDSVEITPNGIFLNTNVLRYNDSSHIKAPSDKPVLYSGFIEFYDGSVFKYDDDYIDTVLEIIDTVISYDFYGSYVSYDDGGWHLAKNTDVEFYPNKNDTIHYISDISLIRVLEEIDPDTWETSYVDYTYQEFYDKFFNSDFEVQL